MSSCPLAKKICTCFEPRSEAEVDVHDGGEAINCGGALLQGRRLRQEDRILCMVDVVLPPFGKSKVASIFESVALQGMAV